MSATIGLVGDPRFGLLAVFCLAFAAYFTGLALAGNRSRQHRVRARIQDPRDLRRRR